jgi:secreted PhoX family phosphatase
MIKAQETTGVVSTPDGKNLFVNFQHPGDRSGVGSFTSNWPDRGPVYRHPSDPVPEVNPTGKRPRSATIVITREDGGVVGL